MSYVLLFCAVTLLLALLHGVENLQLFVIVVSVAVVQLSTFKKIKTTVGVVGKKCNQCSSTTVYHQEHGLPQQTCWTYMFHYKTSLRRHMLI